MAVLFKRFDNNAKEVVDAGVVIEREYHGEDTLPVRGLNLDFDGVEDQLVEKYNGNRLNAVKVPDEEVDISDFQ